MSQLISLPVRRLPLALALTFLLGSLPAWSQQPGGGQPGGGQPGGGATTPGTGGGTTTPTRPGTGTGTMPTTSQQQPQLQMDMPRPVFLTGKVMMEDGMAPPESVTMEIVCNGQVRPQGYTDSKGGFSLALGQNNAMTPDASIGSMNDAFGGFPGSGGSYGSNRQPGQMGVSEKDLLGCELRATLAGFRSDVVPLSGRRTLDKPDIGVILLHRLGNVEGFTYSMTTANAPKDARKAMEKGVDQAKKKKFEEAEANLRKSVEIYPKYATAWFELGRVYDAQKKDAEAKDAYTKSVEADPKYVNPHLMLMGFAARKQDWPDLAAASERVLKLNPYSFPQAWFFNGVANFNLQKVDLAEKSAREAVKLDTQHRIPKAAQLLGVILADKQDYSGALEQLRGYLMLAPNATDAERVKLQVAELEKVAASKPLPAQNQ